MFRKHNTVTTRNFQNLARTQSCRRVFVSRTENPPWPRNEQDPRKWFDYRGTRGSWQWFGIRRRPVPIFPMEDRQKRRDTLRRVTFTRRNSKKRGEGSKGQRRGSVGEDDRGDIIRYVHRRRRCEMFSRRFAWTVCDKNGRYTFEP